MRENLQPIMFYSCSNKKHFVGFCGSLPSANESDEMTRLIIPNNLWRAELVGGEERKQGEKRSFGRQAERKENAVDCKLTVDFNFEGPRLRRADVVVRGAALDLGTIQTPAEGMYINMYITINVNISYVENKHVRLIMSYTNQTVRQTSTIHLHANTVFWNADA
jgi:hypothetical protein